MKIRTSTFLFLLPIALSFVPINVLAEVKSAETAAYSIVQELTISASPNEVFDSMTGDISGWWDHTFSKKPKKLFIEPKAGGGFYEIFDNAGHGVLHATVIFADRGKILRFTGPLGLSGQAVNFVTSIELSPEGMGTRLKLTANVSGQTSAEQAKVVDSVWNHFLVERLKPYVEGNKGKNPGPAK